MHRAVAKKKILAQEMGQKKNSGRLKIPHPPHHFSNGPSLMQEDDVSTSSCRHYQFVNHVFDNFFIMLILFILPRIEKYMERDKLLF